MDQQPLRDIIVLEDSLLASIATRADIVALLPFLQSLTPLKKSGCGRCGAKSNKDQAATYRAAKATIAGLPSETKRRLKELLGTRQLRVVYVNPSNMKTVQLTF